MTTGDIKVNIIDGQRNWLPSPNKVLLQLWRNGSELAHEGFHNANAIKLTFEVHDNLSDQFRVVAYADKYGQSGFYPVNLAAQKTTQVYLMLIPKSGTAVFDDAGPGVLETNGPQLADLLQRSGERSQFETLRTNPVTANECAALLNISAAMDDILLPKHVLKYYSRILWADLPGSTLMREHPQPDRFFGFADRQLVAEIRKLNSIGKFPEEKDPGKKGHPGATCSFKQNLFGEANVQLTFHENTVDPTDPGKIMVEADMDFFADQLSHFFLEVIPNKFSGGKTNPLAVYVLRWMAARQNSLSFNPPYRIR